MKCTKQQEVDLTDYFTCEYLDSVPEIQVGTILEKFSLCNIGPKYVVSERKEFAEKKHSNSKFKEENSSRFYSCGLQQVVVRKRLFVSVLLPSPSWVDSSVVIAALLIRSCQSFVDRPGMHGSGCPGPLTHLFRNLPELPKISLLDFLHRDFMDEFKDSRRFGDTSENDSEAREGSCGNILKSCSNSTGHSVRTR